MTLIPARVAQVVSAIQTPQWRMCPLTLRVRAVKTAEVMLKTPWPAIISCVMMTEYRGWACGPLPSKQLVFSDLEGTRCTEIHPLHVRDMDGLVVYAMERHRHSWGFEP